MNARTRSWRIVLLLLVVNVGIVMAFSRKWLLFTWKEWMTRSQLGFAARQLMDELGEEDKYIMFVPDNREDISRRALILFLNGYGENGRDGARQLSNNFGAPLWETQRTFPFICVAPQCHRRWSIGSDDMKRAIRILDDVMTRYDVDPDRVYLTGVSAGGAGVWNMAAAYPGRFAAIVPLSDVGGVPSTSAIKGFVDHNLAIWDVYNEGDPAVRLVENHEVTRERLFAAGLSPIYTAYEQNHHDCWNAGYRNATMFDWLSKQDRSENRRLGRGARYRELLVDGSGLDEWIPHGPGKWSVSDRVLTCCGTEASGASELTLNAQVAECELHFDYRSTSDACCEIVFESVKSGDDVLRIVFESPAHGTGGILYEQSGEWLGVVNPVSQVEWLSGRWNDLRISLRDSKLRLLLNGAELLEVRSPRVMGTLRPKVRISPRGANDREWRYFRIWESNRSEAP